ncbi:helix-turn-helix domain-containing protein [Streptomyces pseudogriseolus]|uniref:DNA-binding protein n=1 Tax=Streptomyces gancidicus BKS 13-15 TaxID=1284664 RepID=M3DCA6_STREZ|nr:MULTISPECIES: helix-turn-helix transcriptional regulator [Streptomyces]EMF27430.1 DNA-binding protein [Streptomyces gancidicus BKS 13-15]
MTDHAPNEARVIPLRPGPAAPGPAASGPSAPPAAAPREPLWRHLVGDVLRKERQAQERTLKDVADEARISMPYLSEVERGRKEASSEVLAAAAGALGLGLGDLLARTHAELVRVTSRRSAVPARSVRNGSVRNGSVRGSAHDGLCLAA